MSIFSIVALSIASYLVIGLLIVRYLVRRPKGHWLGWFEPGAGYWETGIIDEFETPTLVTAVVFWPLLFAIMAEHLWQYRTRGHSLWKLFVWPRPISHPKP